MGRWQRTGRTIGAGGQAQVFIVRDQTEQLNGEYAMKVLTNAARASRLDLEISTMKSLSRTGAKVIQIVDDYTVTEVDAERPWYVMPIANQGNLQSAIVANECYGGTEELALTTFSQIVNAVRGLHADGVAHRDLKPANILRHNGEIMLCDLGLCLPLNGDTPEERLTGALERIGSVHYIPKEAFGKRPLDRNQYAFDAYALGKILYDLVAGRTLPGFTPPNDPEYDLVKRRGRPIYAGINAVLRGLLIDDPATRLATLDALPARIDSLLDWATERVADVEEDKLREKLAVASEAIARVMAISPSVPESPDVKQDCEAVAGQIAALWAASPPVIRIQNDLVAANPTLLTLSRVNSSPHLRGFVSGPFIKTHRAIEPLEDKGYPRRPSIETGCAIGIIPQSEASPKLPQLWMDCLIGTKEQELYLGFALAKRDSGIDSYSDLIENTANVIGGPRDDPSVIKRALDYASDLSKRFAEQVASDFAKHGAGTT